MTRPTLMRSGVFLVVLFVALALIGSARSSGPSDEVVEADRKPTTTTTTEPPPEGVSIVQIENGAFRPSILKIDVTELPIVKWRNDDDAEYLLTSSDDLWEPVTLLAGEEFEFDFSSVEVGLHRYNATIGFQRVPGTVDTRPDQ